MPPLRMARAIGAGARLLAADKVWTSGDGAAQIEASRAPLMDHLIELRGRLVVCVVAFVLGFLVCFYFASPIQLLLIHPFQVASALRSVIPWNRLIWV